MTDAVPGVVVGAQIEHGHVPTGPAVTNDQLTGPDMGVPAELVAPLTVAVYDVDATRAADGVNRAVFVAVSYAVVPATAAPVEAAKVKLTDDGVTAWSKVAETVVFWATPVLFGAGDCAVTTGAVGPDEDGLKTTSTQ